MDKFCAAALGFFDGVHAAHMEVLKRAAAYAQKNGLKSAAVTFDRPPRPAADGTPLPLICGAEERERIIREVAGIDEVIILTFDDKLRGMNARDFIYDIVYKSLGARYISAGFDYRFGAGGAGDADLLAALCRELGIFCDIVPRFELDGEKVSSTRIRGLITAGEAEAAARLLGRPHSVSGEVIHGKTLGRALGFPTMNIAIPERIVLPAEGDYVSYVYIDGKKYKAVCNIAHGETPLCEVHAFDFSENVYGKTVRAELLHYIRGMKSFNSAADLINQVEFDKKVALDWFSSRYTPD